MTKLTLKTAGLLTLVLFSTQGLAKSPWADEPVATETISDDTFSDNSVTPEPVQNIPAPVTETINDEPIEPIEPINQAPAQTTENFEPEVTTQTTQQGDVLNVPSSDEFVAVTLLDFPRRGMTTDKVENELGRPGEIIPAIGQPPITRWVYDDRTVYFEYSTVLHVVAR
jgi:hypothetical protein